MVFFSYTFDCHDHPQGGLVINTKDINNRSFTLCTLRKYHYQMFVF